MEKKNFATRMISGTYCLQWFVIRLSPNGLCKFEKSLQKWITNYKVALDILQNVFVISKYFFCYKDSIEDIGCIDLMSIYI